MALPESAQNKDKYSPIYVTVPIDDAQSQIAHIFICQMGRFDIFICQKKFIYLGHKILKIYAQSWCNLKMYGNDVYSSGLATRNDLCFDKTNIQAVPEIHGTSYTRIRRYAVFCGRFRSPLTVYLGDRLYILYIKNGRILNSRLRPVPVLHRIYPGRWL